MQTFPFNNPTLTQISKQTKNKTDRRSHKHLTKKNQPLLSKRASDRHKNSFPLPQALTHQKISKKHA